MKEKNYREISRNGSKGVLVRADRTLLRFQVGNRWIMGGRGLVAPLKKFRMSGCLVMESDEPHINMEERAATCQQRVLGARPDIKPSCKKSKMLIIETEVGTSLHLPHQIEKDFHVASYMRLVEALEEA